MGSHSSFLPGFEIAPAPPKRSVEGAALLSPCGLYRYWLTRTFLPLHSRKTVVFVMLNPSTADAVYTDATTTRCLGFTEDWGFDCLKLVNLFAFRARDPRRLLEVPDPIGPENDRHIAEAVLEANRVVLAWGRIARQHVERARAVERKILELRAGHPEPVVCLGMTEKDPKEPRHPLFVAADKTPVPFEATRT